MRSPKLLILGTSVANDPPNYRGVYRHGPSYVSSLNEDHPANQLYYWRVRDYAETSLLDDFDTSRRLIDVYRSLDPPQQFEIVEATDGDEQPVLNGHFLGFDVAFRYSRSLIILVLNDTRAEGLPYGVEGLVRLVQAHFSSQLNEHYLFSDQETAAWFLECVRGIHHFHPIWEAFTDEFRAIGMWSVYGSIT